MSYQKVVSIDPFAVTDAEYDELQKRFVDLCYFASWQLIRKNVKNNHTEDIDDIMQKLHMSLIRAGRYYKRQVYIEDCLDKIEKYAKSDFMIEVVKELKFLWKNKTKHGAHRQKFGQHQEKLLDVIVNKCVPTNEHPDKKRPLEIDKKFTTYIKAICWNEQKSMGRKITRERDVRAGIVSLSEFEFIGNNI